MSRTADSRVLLVTALVLAAAAASPFARDQTSGLSNPPPSKLWAAQTGPKQITLVWSRVQGGFRYRIYEDTGAGGKLVGQTTASGEQYVRAVSAYNVEHRFFIDVVFENGETSTRAAFNPVIPRETTPRAVAGPASVRAAAAEVGVSVSWDAVPGATAYRIARQIVPGGFQILCRLCPTETTYLDRTTIPGSRHIYSITAVAPAGVSRPVRSNEIVATGLATPIATPAPAEVIAPATGTITVGPVRGGCLSLGEQGNLLVRLADGSVRLFERVHYGRHMRIVPNPEFHRVAGIENAVAVATSGPHSLVLRSDGTILAWGRNLQGQLGRQGFTDPVSETPMQVQGISNAVAIAAGAEHSMALLADGTLRVWGSGARGIGGGGAADPMSNRRVPGPVPGLSQVKAIAAGAQTSFALLSDGSVRGWGGNWGGLGFFGVLGIGDQRIEHSATPLSVNGVSHAVAISTSGRSSLALLADGRVMAWGAATAPMRGQRENYLVTSRALPVPAIRTATAVSPFLILLADGTVRELSDPEQAVPGVANAVAVVSDPTNRYALLADGRLVGWGLKQFWPKGMVTVAEFGAETARACGR